MPDFSHIVESQRAFFQTGATRPISFRVEMLKKLEAMLRSNESVLHQMIYKDFGKSEFESFTNELMVTYQELKLAIQSVKKWSGKKRIRTNFYNIPGKAYTVSEPLGTALIIGPWNYPYQLLISPAIAAIAAGNTMVLKPSELCPNVSSILRKLISETFDPHYITLIEGGVEVSQALLEIPFDKIFFTGSPKVGKIVYEAAAKNLIPVTLELGGKSPAIILPSCDLDMAVKRIIWGKFLNSGQTCVAPDYVFVHSSLYDAFLNKAKKQIDASDYSLDHGNLVQIINEHHFDRLLSLMDESKVFYGGGFDRSKRTIQPTLLTGVHRNHPSMEEEIFGPILPVLIFHEVDEVIHYVKSYPKPLACYIFTTKRAEKEELLSTLSFGGGCINDVLMHLPNPYLPYGGVGQSGLGSYHGVFGFNAFSHLKAVQEKWNWIELNIKHSPYTETKMKWFRRLSRWF